MPNFYDDEEARLRKLGGLAFPNLQAMVGSSPQESSPPDLGNLVADTSSDFSGFSAGARSGVENKIRPVSPPMSPSMSAGPSPIDSMFGDLSIKDAREEAARKNMVTGILSSLSTGLESATGARSPTAAFQMAEKQANAVPEDIREYVKRKLDEKKLGAQALRDLNELDYRNKSLGVREREVDIKKQTSDRKAAAAGNALKYEGDLAIINRIPKLSQDDAVVEARKAAQYKKGFDYLDQAYGEASQTSLVKGKVPSWMLSQGSSELYEMLKGTVGAEVMSQVPGLRSDADFKLIVTPMLSKGSETPEIAAKKFDTFMRWLKSKAPATPLLDSVGGNPYQKMLTPSEKRARILELEKKK
jgi:hypothetical protein